MSSSGTKGPMEETLLDDSSDDPLDMLEPPPERIGPTAKPEQAAIAEHDISIETPEPSLIDSEDAPAVASDGDAVGAAFSRPSPVHSDGSGKTPVVKVITRPEALAVAPVAPRAPELHLPTPEPEPAPLPSPLPSSSSRSPSGPIPTPYASSASGAMALSSQPVMPGAAPTTGYAASGSGAVRMPTAPAGSASGAVRIPAATATSGATAVMLPVAMATAPAAPPAPASPEPGTKARISISVLGFAGSLFGVYLGGIATAILITKLASPTPEGTVLVPIQAMKAVAPIAAPLPAAPAAATPVVSAALPTAAPAPAAPAPAAPAAAAAPKAVRKPPRPAVPMAAPAAPAPAAEKPKKVKKQGGWPDPFSS